LNQTNNSTNHQEAKLQFSSSLEIYTKYFPILNQSIFLDQGRTVLLELGIHGGYLTLVNPDGQLRIYQVVQMHLHGPAEHTFNNQTRRYDLELHIVHQRSSSLMANDLAVLAIFFNT
jgi:carbonic anhydrase